MLGDFEDETGAPVGDLERIEDRRKVFIEMDVDDGTDHSDDFSLAQRSRFGLGRGVCCNIQEDKRCKKTPSRFSCSLKISFVKKR